MMDRHYNDQLSLALVSDWVGVSESYLSKMFVKEVGVNFHDYITRIRIEKAEQMIFSGMKIYEIGRTV
jgi:two-component system response regulator YesN